ncbi:MAG TPA: hypothetical protein VN632_02590 [Stellaceae bacterium]|nr:hypothetical protein [Stellaceae bacterium]
MTFHRFIFLALLFVALGTAAHGEDRGAYLARIGDCVSCHTAPGGKPFSGGLSDGDARDIAAFLATLRGAGA